MISLSYQIFQKFQQLEIKFLQTFLKLFSKLPVFKEIKFGKFSEV